MVVQDLQLGFRLGRRAKVAEARCTEPCPCESEVGVILPRGETEVDGDNIGVGSQVQIGRRSLLASTRASAHENGQGEAARQEKWVKTWRR
jgi:hypothetical protein